MTDDARPRTVTGKYVLLPNPCTTRPCLPGMAYAIESGGQQLFLTRAGRWSASALTWGDFAPDVGDTVTVVGQVSQRTDVRGQPFFTIEVESLVPGSSFER